MFEETIQKNSLTRTEKDVKGVGEANKINTKDINITQSIKDQKTEIQSQTTT